MNFMIFREKRKSREEREREREMIGPVVEKGNRECIGSVSRPSIFRPSLFDHSKMNEWTKHVFFPIPCGVHKFTRIQ